jgi:hypothetical protein
MGHNYLMSPLSPISSHSSPLPPFALLDSMVGRIRVVMSCHVDGVVRSGNYGISSLGEGTGDRYEF